MAVEEVFHDFVGKRILIAGATGLMGTTALLRFKNYQGVSVRATYHKKEPFIFGDNISYVKADLRNFDDCKKVVKGVDFVLMFAAVLSTAPVIAKNPVSHITSNLTMNAQMLEASYFAGVKKFIWLSSSTGYPESQHALSEDHMFTADPPDVHFSVGWMSRYTEVLCRMYATKMKSKMPCLILRPTTIYGEYEGFDLERCHMLPALVKRVCDREDPLVVWGNGQDSRDLIYCEDVFDACLLAMQKLETFDVFNLGSGRQYTVDEILELIIEISGFRDARVEHDTSKPSTVKKRLTDLTKAQRELGFRARTDIRRGIERLVNFYRRSKVASVPERQLL